MEGQRIQRLTASGDNVERISAGLDDYEMEIS